MFQPLEGIRVVDLSQVLAGPYATYQLALMGADVIKIEKPGEGDWTRTGGPVPELSARHMGMGFLTQNGGKKSVTLDLKASEGLALAKRLIASADIFVENFKPGVATRLGLGPEALAEINPRLVYCSISAYGQTGPFSPRPAYDHVIQGMCGIMKTTGKPGDGPTKVGAPYVDYATGMNAAMAVLAALMEVRRTGRGVQIDVAMLDTALMLMASLVTQTLSSDWLPAQNGNEAWSASPSSGAFETADGMLMLAANNNRQFARLCSAIDRADILADTRWSDPEARQRNGSALRETLEESFRARSAAAWETLLSAAEVPAARVRRLDETMAEAHLARRHLTSAVHLPGHPDAVHLPNLGFHADGAPTVPASPPASLGADTDEVLQGMGLGTEEIAALRRAQVI